MNLLSLIKPHVKNVRSLLIKESPTILTWLSVIGVPATVGFAIRGTAQATSVLIMEEIERGEKILISKGKEPEIIHSPLTKKESFKLVWRYYIPTVISGITTVACIVGSNHINLKRNAAIATAFTLTDAALREYQSKVVELMGEKKDQKIRDEIAQDKLNNDPIDESRVIITGRGDSLFYDSLSGRYFRSNIESIRKIQNDFNAELLVEMYKTLNEFYDLVGLEETEMGKDVGWNTDNGLNGMLDIHFSAKIATDGVPCVVLEYKVLPKKL